MVRRFEQVCRRRGLVLGCLGASVKPLGGVLRRLGAFLGRLGVVLGGLRVVEETFWRLVLSFQASWQRLGEILEPSWSFLGRFSESRKHLGSDMTLTVHFEEVRSQLWGRLTLILEENTE